MFLEKAKRARRMMRNGTHSSLPPPPFLPFCYFNSLFFTGRSRTYADRKRHSSARLSIAGNSSPVMIKKANSCSTIYTDDSTVSLPNLKVTLKW